MNVKMTYLPLLAGFALVSIYASKMYEYDVEFVLDKMRIFENCKMEKIAHIHGCH